MDNEDITRTLISLPTELLDEYRDLLKKHGFTFSGRIRSIVQQDKEDLKEAFNILNDQIQRRKKNNGNTRDKRS